MHRVFCFFFSVVRYKVMIPSAFNTELNKINSTSWLYCGDKRKNGQQKYSF